MTVEEKSVNGMPLFYARSHMSTEINKTGMWRFVRPRYDEKTAPCSVACPAGTDISRIEMQISRGLFKEAGETLLWENPFPSTCGHVCFHPCEASCNRNEWDEPVAIQHLERFLGDTVLSNGKERAMNPLPDNGKRVAIVGAGPAGLSAAYFMAALGYTCEVFDQHPEPGGVLRWGIPGFRLPAHILKNEIQRIEHQGVKIHCQKPVTQDFLKNEKGRFDVIFMACGHTKPVEMKIPGAEKAIEGLEFLHRFRQNQTSGVKGSSAVIGGGNTAVDVARSLVRAGTNPILVYRRRKKDMPAFQHEVEMAIEEGVEIIELVAPLQMQEQKGGYLLTLQRMKTSGRDDRGRANVVPDGSGNQTLSVRNVFSAIGAEAGKSWYLPADNAGKSLSLTHTVFTLGDRPAIFGGDLTNQIKSVADAIASGKQAAMALDIYFKKGWEAIEECLDECRVGDGPSLSMEIYRSGDRKKRNPHVVLFDEINKDYFESSSRVPATHGRNGLHLPTEPEPALPTKAAIKEAERCFNCGICNDCDNCWLFCPEVAIGRGEKRVIDLDYCKGCGICMTECPRNAIVLEEENI